MNATMATRPVTSRGESAPVRPSSAAAALAPGRWATVPEMTIRTAPFPTPRAAGSFVAYMSDGGGEYGFLEPMDDVIEQGDLTEADRVSQFDYSRDNNSIVAS